MGAHDIEPKETIPASRKLGREDAAQIAAKANKLIIAKGKKITTFATKGGPSDEAIDAMLGPTGNLRAPTLITGKTVMVGFNEEQYAALLTS